ncbi:MAG: YitT family protein [Clostridia bacterium]|nr:YitT family protein [Clostridia bacterium]
MSKLKSFLIIILGTMTTGFAISVFLTPNKIVGGGVSGISTILFHTLHIPTGLSFIVLNLVLLLLGIKILGKEFIVKTLIGTSLLSVFIEVFSHIPLYTENTMLATLFGGGLYGIGIGISFVAKASTGGTDILGRIVQKVFPTVPIGKLLLAIDGVVIFTSFIVFGEIELTLFGVVSLLISSFTIDFVIAQFNISRIAFVITEKGDDISKFLVSTSPRGVTIIDVVGAYTMDEKKMLFCALKEGESFDFQRKILEIDPEAFIVFSESQRIKGNGFYLYN